MGNVCRPSPLRVARVAAGLYLRDIAQAVDRSISFVHRLEVGGYARLTPEIAFRIGEAVGVPAPILFPGRVSR